ncbi:MAG: hypothetical protein E7396_00050 [Ruminococcaceae bacterium]|nr:hypothetical protein [Oscillospiraceae bacterium]
MKKIITKQSIEEKHSNLTLVSSVLSLILFTVILFIYNNTTNPTAIEFCSSLSLSLSFLFGGIALIIAVMVFIKKDTFLTEYSSVMAILSAVFFILKGNTLTAFIGGSEKAILLAVFVVALYWIVAIIYHCFLKEKMTPNMVASYIIIGVSFAILIATILLNYFVTPSILL